MKRKRVLIGCPLWNSAWILDEYLNRIQAQKTPDVDIETVFVLSHSEDNTYEILMKDGRVDWVIPGPDSPRTFEDHVEHRWGKKYYQHMAVVRNMLVRFAHKYNNESIDYFFSVDSDILLRENTVSALIKQLEKQGGGAISPLVNMAPFSHTQEDTAWNYMYWSNKRVGHGFRPEHDLHSNEMVHRVNVIMAAMLLDRSAMQCRWKSHDQGEDIGWSVDAHNKGVKLYIHKGIEAFHQVRRY